MGTTKPKVTNEAAALMHDSLPPHFQDAESLEVHLAESFGDADNASRGERFAAFAIKLVSVHRLAERFGEPSLSKNKTHDRGVDFSARSGEGELIGQSKLHVRTKAQLDSILSHFDAVERKKTSGDGSLFGEGEPPHFCIVTASKLSGVVDSYTRSSLSSRGFYNTLLAERRLTIIDLPEVLSLLSGTYKKAFFLPTKLEISSANGWASQGPVHLGFISGEHLVALYRQHGDSLFFENIRDFLGIYGGRVSDADGPGVNQEIIETVKTEPERMAERNNGVTFRVTKVDKDEGGTMHATEGAIVNGCQTTMCLVTAAEEGADLASCLVPAKIVETPDAWAVAKAANYQNRVNRIDLEIEKYLRPQVARRAAARSGVAVDRPEGKSAMDVLEVVSDVRVQYQLAKSIFLGIFSQSPSNLFRDNYTKIMQDVLEALFARPEAEGEDAFAAILEMAAASTEANDAVAAKVADGAGAPYFKRLSASEGYKYRALLALLSFSGVCGVNVAQRESAPAAEAERIVKFLGECRRIASAESDRLRTLYFMSYNVVADTVLDEAWKREGDENLILQRMHTAVRSQPFEKLYMKLRMKVEEASVLAELNPVS